MKPHAHVDIVGRLIQDPEEKTVNGKLMKQFAVAVDGGSSSSIFNSVVWEDAAKAFTAKKGDLIQLEGSLRVDHWKDEKTQEPRSRIKIITSFAQTIDLTQNRYLERAANAYAQDLEVGTSVRAERDLPESAVTKGEVGTVTRISDETVTLRFQNGSRTTLALKDAAILTTLDKGQNHEPHAER